MTTEIDAIFEKQSRWPMVIGVINIVLGSLGLLCYTCGSLNAVASPFLAGMVPPDQRPATAGGAQLVVQIVQTCAAWALSVWLLVAGIGLTRRRAWARVHCLGWSVAKIVLTLLGTLAGLLFAPMIAQQINDQLSQQGQAPFTVTVPIIMFVSLIMTAFLLIWPLFMLMWFMRGRIREEVEAWAAESRAAI